MATIPVNIAKILISVFRLIVFLEKRNHIPITENIRKTDKNVNDKVKLVVKCSATESVRLSWVVKKGFTALRYLKEGKLTIPELKTPIPDAINEIKTSMQLRIFARSLLNFITIPDIIIKIVGRRITIPAYPMINVEVLSNTKENRIKDIENEGAAQIMKLSLFLKNGNEKKNRTIGIKKNKIPPHADNPSDKKNPAAINFISEIFPLLNFNPETKRYIAINAKKSPKGSDLNQPINPLEKIGIDTEKINAANKPAVVPPKTRTNANTAMAVNEPTTKGRSTVKS